MTADDSTTLPLVGDGARKGPRFFRSSVPDTHRFKSQIEVGLLLCRICGWTKDQIFHFNEEAEAILRTNRIDGPLGQDDCHSEDHKRLLELAMEVQGIKAGIMMAQTLDGAKAILYRGKKQ